MNTYSNQSTLTTLEATDNRYVWGQVEVENILLRFSQTATYTGSASAYAQVYDGAYATYRGTDGHFWCSPFGGSWVLSHSAQLDTGSYKALKSGLVTNGLGGLETVMTAKHDSSGIQVYARLASDTTGSSLVSVGPVFGPAFRDDSLRICRVNAVCPTTTGAIVCVGEYDFYLQLATLSFWLVTLTTSRKLDTIIQYAFTESYQGWSLNDPGGSFVQAIDDGHTITVAAFDSRRCKMFHITNGIESDLSQPYPIDDTFYSAQVMPEPTFVPTGLTNINGMYYLSGNITRPFTDGSAVYMEIYLTSDDMFLWSLGEFSSYVCSKPMHGQLVLDGSYVRFIGNGYVYSAPARPLDGVGSPTDISANATSVQMDLGESMADSGTLNTLSVTDLAATAMGNQVTVSGGYASGASRYGGVYRKFIIDEKPTPITVNGREMVTIGMIDLANWKLKQWGSPTDITRSSRTAIQSDMSALDQLIVQSPLRDITTAATGTSSAALNDPFVAITATDDARDGLQKSVVRFTNTDAIALSSFGFIFGGDDQGNFNALMIPRPNSWVGHTQTQPQVLEGIVPAGYSWDTHSMGIWESLFLDNLTKMMWAPSASAYASGVLLDNYASAQGEYFYYGTFTASANTDYQYSSRTSGRRVQLYQKQVDHTRSMTVFADTLPVMEYRFNSYQKMKTAGRGGIIMGTDVPAATSWYRQATYGDLDIPLTGAGNSQTFSHVFSMATRIDNLSGGSTGIIHIRRDDDFFRDGNIIAFWWQPGPGGAKRFGWLQLNLTDPNTVIDDPVTGAYVGYYGFTAIVSRDTTNWQGIPHLDGNIRIFNGDPSQGGAICTVWRQDQDGKPTNSFDVNYTYNNQTLDSLMPAHTPANVNVLMDVDGGHYEGVTSSWTNNAPAHDMIYTVDPTTAVYWNSEGFLYLPINTSGIWGWASSDYLSTFVPSVDGINGATVPQVTIPNNPGITTLDIPVSGKAIFIDDNQSSTQVTIRYVTTDGRYHKLESGNEVFLTGWDPSNPMQDPNDGPRAWTMKMNHGVFFEGDPSQFGIGVTPPISTMTVGTPTSGGSVNSGTHSYVVSFLYGSTASSIAGPRSVQLTVHSNKTIPLTNIPIGPAGCTARAIFRTPAGDVPPYYLVTIINDNVTTTYTDTTSDSGMTSDSPPYGDILFKVEDELMRAQIDTFEAADHSYKHWTMIPTYYGIASRRTGPQREIMSWVHRSYTSPPGQWYEMDRYGQGNATGMLVEIRSRTASTQIAPGSTQYYVDHVNPPPAWTIAPITSEVTSNVCRIGNRPYPLYVGDKVYIAGATHISGINGYHTVTGVDVSLPPDFTFNYTHSNVVTAAETGTINHNTGTAAAIILDRDYEPNINAPGRIGDSSAAPADVIIASGRGQLGTQKVIHPSNAAVCYVPGVQPDYIQVKRYDWYAGLYNSVQDDLAYACALGGARGTQFRYRSSWSGNLTAASHSLLDSNGYALNLSDFVLDLNTHIFADMSNGLSGPAPIRVGFRSSYQLDIDQDIYDTGLTSTGRIGNIRLVLRPTHSGIFGSILERVVVMVTDDDISGAWSGSHTEDTTKLVNIRLIVRGNLVTVEMEKRMIWQFNLDDYWYIDGSGNTQSNNFQQSGPVTVQYTTSASPSIATTAIVLELDSEVENHTIDMGSVGTDAIQFVASDRHIWYRSKQNGGLQFSKYINRDDSGAYHGNIYEDDQDQLYMTPVGHVIATGAEFGEYVDEAWIQQNGYRAGLAQNRLLLTVPDSKEEARLLVRMSKEGAETSVLFLGARFVPEVSDKFTAGYGSPGDLLYKPDMSYVVGTIRIDLQENKIDGEMDLRTYYDY